MQMIYTEDVSKIKNDVDDDIPNSVILEMRQDRLSKVLDAIPPGDKAILLMKYIDDMPIKDIAEILDKTESAIKMQIMRAKIKAQSLHDEMFGKEALENSDFFEMPIKTMKNE